MVYDGDRIYMTMSNTPYYYGYYMNGNRPSVGGVASGGGDADVRLDERNRRGTGGSTDPAPDTSDHLAIIDMSQRKLTTTYDQPTELYNLDLMGVQQNKLFVNLQGDGILVVDVASAARPRACPSTARWAMPRASNSRAPAPTCRPTTTVRTTST
jgi:hypothetical protein